MKKTDLIFLLAFTCFFTTTFGQQNPVRLGTASNIFTIVEPFQNQVYTDDLSKLVVFVHRQDASLFNGSSGVIRYDYSTNGGTTFQNNQGPLTVFNLFECRYPQITGFNPRGSRNPLSIEMAWQAATLNVGWDGFATGLTNGGVALQQSSTTYNQMNSNNFIQYGLCQGAPGEFWSTSLSYNAGSGTTTGNVIINKGIYDQTVGDIIWSKHVEKSLPNDVSGSSGSHRLLGPNMSFSPDGQTGWTAVLGDLVGGPQYTFNPILIKSSNGGATWGSPVEVNLNTAAYIGDLPTLAEELQAFWTNASGGPAGSGVATCGFEFDLTVDINGNPHFFVVVGNQSAGSNNYAIESALAKMVVDVTSDNGGASWKVIKISPTYGFRGFHGNSNTTVSMDNFTQVSRTESGSHIFYSWTDIDTNGNVFNSFNDSPNLRIAGLRVSDSYQTCPRWITHGGNFDGKVLYPTMSPTVLTNTSASVDYNLPIVLAEMVSNDPLSTARFWYVGNDATLREGDFKSRQTINLISCFTPLGIYETDRKTFSIAPNPSHGIVELELPENVFGEISVSIINSIGQVVQKLSYQIEEENVKLDVSALHHGVYIVLISTLDGSRLSSRLVKI